MSESGTFSFGRNRQRNNLLLIGAGFALFAGASATKASIIYQDTFSRSGALAGSKPTTDVGGEGATADATWVAGGTVSTNGSAATTTGVESAFLPFVPATGQIYTISATVSATSGDYVAFGFANGMNTSGSWQSNNNPVDWLALNTAGVVQGFGVTNNLMASGAGTQGGTYTVTLNTIGPQWTYGFSGPGLNSSTFTFAANPTITSLGFGTDATGAASISDFTVDPIPEPASIGIFSIVGAGLLVRRRHQN